MAIEFLRVAADSKPNPTSKIPESYGSTKGCIISISDQFRRMRKEQIKQPSEVSKPVLALFTDLHANNIEQERLPRPNLRLKYTVAVS